MVDYEYITKTLPLMVAGYGGYAIVRVYTYDGKGYLVRDVVKTNEGAVTFNVWTDSRGDNPIIGTTSDLHDFEVFPMGYRGLTLPFEYITSIDVIPATALQPGRFH